jgi:hypothetical protein
MWILIAQRIVLDFLLHVIYFPFWWYTGGIKHAGLYCVNLLRSGSDYLAPGLWLQNIFVPMFGQSDWQGRIVSVLIRIVNIIGRGFGLLIWTVVVFALFILWIIWPIFVIYTLIMLIGLRSF